MCLVVLFCYFGCFYAPIGDGGAIMVGPGFSAASSSAQRQRVLRSEWQCLPEEVQVLLGEFETLKKEVTLTAGQVMKLAAENLRLASAAEQGMYGDAASTVDSDAASTVDGDAEVFSHVSQLPAIREEGGMPEDPVLKRQCERNEYYKSIRYDTAKARLVVEFVHKYYELFKMHQGGALTPWHGIDAAAFVLPDLLHMTRRFIIVRVNKPVQIPGDQYGALEGVALCAGALHCVVSNLEYSKLFIKMQQPDEAGKMRSKPKDLLKEAKTIAFTRRAADKIMTHAKADDDSYSLIEQHNMFFILILRECYRLCPEVVHDLPWLPDVAEEAIKYYGVMDLHKVQSCCNARDWKRGFRNTRSETGSDTKSSG